MEEQASVLEYKCPCCDAGLQFDKNTQNLTCEYCGNTFDIDAVRAYNEPLDSQATEENQWEETEPAQFTEDEESSLRGFVCPTCAGQIIADENTAATFCPYCGNPTIMPTRLSGNLKPDGVIPFKTGKEDAKNAYLRLCKGKPLLPKDFTSHQHVEKITGMYVPFWLYDCGASYSGRFQATRVHSWSDSNYRYTRTEHFLLQREADASFSGIPMDGSSKMEDSFMESIEPFDYSQIQPFDMAYLSGFLADKYDVPEKDGRERVRQRVDAAMSDQVKSTCVGYASVIPTSCGLSVKHGKSRYVLLPVWILNTKYKDKIYTFAMNGQTGKMTGAFPVCPKRTAAWFAGITAGVTLLASLIQLLIL